MNFRQQYFKLLFQISSSNNSYRLCCANILNAILSDISFNVCFMCYKQLTKPLNQQENESINCLLISKN